MRWNTIGLILRILSILVVIFFEQKKPSEALFWVILILISPAIGVPLYLIFGATIGFSWAKIWRKKRYTDLYMQVLQREIQGAHEQRAAEIAAKQPDVTGLVRLNAVLGDSVLTQHNRAQIYTNGKEKYEQLFADMEAAEISIHMEYYGFHPDKVGKKVIEVLTAKAEQGLDVKLMFDGIGGLRMRNRYFKNYLQAGGMLVRTKSIFTHFRNHRKIVVIDGDIGYTGGMNIGRQYINEHKKKTPWRDTHLRVVGDACYSLQYFFLLDWVVNSNPRRTGLTPHLIRKLFVTHEVKETLYCQVVAGGIDDERQSIKMGFLKMIAAAKHKIVLQTPYFIPDNTLLNAFKMAAASGVEVEIMLPQVSPSFFLKPASDYYIAQMLPLGVKVSLYDGYLHAKTMLVDDNQCVIGSANMDIRSMEVDDEVCIFFYGEEMNARYREVIRTDKEWCMDLDAKAFLNRSIWRRMNERIFALFAPLL